MAELRIEIQLAPLAVTHPDHLHLKPALLSLWPYIFTGKIVGFLLSK